MKIGLCYLILAIVLLFGCSNFKLYRKLERQQHLALVEHLSSEGSSEFSITNTVRLDKNRLRKSLKKIVNFIEDQHPDFGNFIVLEINSFPGYLYQGLIFDLDRLVGVKFKFINGELLFEKGEYDSEFRDYKSYIDQYLTFGCHKFHDTSKVNSPDDIFIPYSFITKVNLKEDLIQSCAFQAYYWRINSNFKGINIFNNRVID